MCVCGGERASGASSRQASKGGVCVAVRGVCVAVCCVCVAVSGVVWVGLMCRRLLVLQGFSADEPKPCLTWAKAQWATWVSGEWFSRSSTGTWESKRRSKRKRQKDRETKRGRD